MSKWADKFNELPEEIRVIGCACELETRIQHLVFEKNRLRKRYIQSIREINQHIENCKKSLADLDK